MDPNNNHKRRQPPSPAMETDGSGSVSRAAPLKKMDQRPSPAYKVGSRHTLIPPPGAGPCHPANLTANQKAFLSSFQPASHQLNKSTMLSGNTPPKAAKGKKSKSKREEENFEMQGGKWAKEEDEKLRAGVAQIGAKNWKRIAAEFLDGTRSDVQCLHRWQKVLKPGLVKGNWTAEEDNMVIDCIKAGITKWSEIADRIPGRIGKQCRERWFNHLDPSIKKTPWTHEEDALLVNAQAELGNRWIDIAKLLPGRTENSIKNRWNSAMRRNFQKNNPASTVVVGQFASMVKTKDQSMSGLGINALGMDVPHRKLTGIISRMQDPSAQAGDKARIAQKIKVEQRQNSGQKAARPRKQQQSHQSPEADKEFAEGDVEDDTEREKDRGASESIFRPKKISPAHTGHPPRNDSVNRSYRDYLAGIAHSTPESMPTHTSSPGAHLRTMTNGDARNSLGSDGDGAGGHGNPHYHHMHLGDIREGGMGSLRMGTGVQVKLEGGGGGIVGPSDLGLRMGMGVGTGESMLGLELTPDGGMGWQGGRGISPRIGMGASNDSIGGLGASGNMSMKAGLQWSFPGGGLDLTGGDDDAMHGIGGGLDAAADIAAAVDVSQDGGMSGSGGMGNSIAASAMAGMAVLDDMPAFTDQYSNSQFSADRRGQDQSVFDFNRNRGGTGGDDVYGDDKNSDDEDPDGLATSMSGMSISLDSLPALNTSLNFHDTGSTSQLDFKMDPPSTPAQDAQQAQYQQQWEQQQQQWEHQQKQYSSSSPSSKPPSSFASAVDAEASFAAAAVAAGLVLAGGPMQQGSTATIFATKQRTSPRSAPAPPLASSPLGAGGAGLDNLPSAYSPLQSSLTPLNSTSPSTADALTMPPPWRQLPPLEVGGKSMEGGSSRSENEKVHADRNSGGSGGSGGSSSGGSSRESRSTSLRKSPRSKLQREGAGGAAGGSGGDERSGTMSPTAVQLHSVNHFFKEGMINAEQKVRCRLFDVHT
jgi:hypothetical protein